MTDQERHAAAVETLRALRSICARHPELSGCRHCQLSEWCGTRAPDSITDEEIDRLADLAVAEAYRTKAEEVNNTFSETEEQHNGDS